MPGWYGRSVLSGSDNVLEGMLWGSESLHCSGNYKLMGYNCTWIMVLPENWEKQWEAINTEANFLGKREELYLSIHIDVGKKSSFEVCGYPEKKKFPSLMQVLLLALGELFVPGSEWEESAHCVVSGPLCSELLPAESMGLMLWKQHWGWLLLIRWWYRNQEEVTFSLLTQERMAITFCSLPFF